MYKNRKDVEKNKKDIENRKTKTGRWKNKS